eukprot:Rmarinus@m.9682
MASQPIIPFPKRKSLRLEDTKQNPPENDRAIPLPPTYQLLYDFFVAMDSTVALYTNTRRRTIPTFSEVQKGVQQMTNRSFLPVHVAQMKALVPDMLNVGWKTVKPAVSPSGRHARGHQEMTIEFERNWPDTIVSPRRRTPSQLSSARKAFFRSALVDRVREYHSQFLQDLGEPLSPAVASKIHAWHVSFDLSKVPDLPVAHLPSDPASSRPTDVAHSSTADVARTSTVDAVDTRDPADVRTDDFDVDDSLSVSASEKRLRTSPRTRSPPSARRRLAFAPAPSPSASSDPLGSPLLDSAPSSSPLRSPPPSSAPSASTSRGAAKSLLSSLSAPQNANPSPRPRSTPRARKSASPEARTASSRRTPEANESKSPRVRNTEDAPAGPSTGSAREGGPRAVAPGPSNPLSPAGASVRGSPARSQTDGPGSASSGRGHRSIRELFQDIQRRQGREENSLHRRRERHEEFPRLVTLRPLPTICSLVHSIFQEQRRDAMELSMLADVVSSRYPSEPKPSKDQCITYLRALFTEAPNWCECTEAAPPRAKRRLHFDAGGPSSTPGDRPRSLLLGSGSDGGIATSTATATATRASPITTTASGGGDGGSGSGSSRSGDGRAGSLGGTTTNTRTETIFRLRPGAILQTARQLLADRIAELEARTGE